MRQNTRNISIQKTDDGSYTLFLQDIEEHYHSVKGALTESRHVFIKEALTHSAAQSPAILEVGFGTGFNAFLTQQFAEENKKKIHYTGIELYPLDNEIVNTLTSTGIVNSDQMDVFCRLHNFQWGEEVNISPHFRLLKLNEDFTHFDIRSNSYDIVYFDAFSPEKQPEMWSEELFRSLYNGLRQNGILTTYCAKGIIRRRLQAVGFMVERLPGPPEGKREILRATKI